MVAIVPRTDETTYGPVLFFFNCVIIVGLRATKTCHRPVSHSPQLLFLPVRFFRFPSGKFLLEKKTIFQCHSDVFMLDLRYAAS